MQYPSCSTLLVNVSQVQEVDDVTEDRPTSVVNYKSSDNSADVLSLLQDIKANDVEGIFTSSNKSIWGDDIADSVGCAPLRVMGPLTTQSADLRTTVDNMAVRAQQQKKFLRAQEVGAQLGKHVAGFLRPGISQHL